MLYQQTQMSVCGSGCVCDLHNYRRRSQVWSIEYRYKSSQSQKLIRDKITSPQWKWNARNTRTTWTAFTAISMNALMLVSNHSQAELNHQWRGLSVKAFFGWLCQNGNEASACLHLIREVWKEESGGGRAQQRGRRWWRKPWLQGWRTDTRAGGQTGGKGLTCCRCGGLGLASTTDPPEGEFKGASWDEQLHQRSF